MSNLLILTWNPDHFEMDWVQESQRMAQGSSSSDTWSVGSRRGGIVPGDRLLLLRQARDRGIIASGTATSIAYEGPHWDDERDDTAWYVDVDWKKHVGIEDRLTIKKLREIAPDTHWTPFGSGTRVREPDASRVWQAWLSHHDDVDSRDKGKKKRIAVREPRHFLYPITDNSEYSIGGDERTDLTAFLQSASAGKTATWRLATNFRRLQSSDWIWAYFGMPDGAVRAVGRVVDEPFWHSDWEEWACRIRWDRKLCRELARDPIPYSAFEQRIWSAPTEANDRTHKVLKSWLNSTRPSDVKAIDREVEMVRRMVKTRKGQSTFRKDLMRHQGGKCAVTGCAEQSVLEAAHVRGVSADGLHSIRNGLLLRADIHSLFDSGLLVIDDDFKVRIDLDVIDQQYRRLEGTRLNDLAKLSRRRLAPPMKTLRWHRQAHGWE